uniref:Uncharacterized protein n=1 Tax=Arundo donax TaxID=35708 RepID=A0A0A8ZRS1_ARUDO
MKIYHIIFRRKQEESQSTFELNH